MRGNERRFRRFFEKEVGQAARNGETKAARGVERSAFTRFLAGVFRSFCFFGGRRNGDVGREETAARRRERARLRGRGETPERGRRGNKKRKEADRSVSFLVRPESVGASGCKAFAAVHRFAFGRIEGHFAGLAALGADGIEHLAIASGRSLAGVTAFFASLGFVLETLFRIELLLTGGEHEILAALLALQCLVLIHVFYLAKIFALRRIPTDAFVYTNALP